MIYISAEIYFTPKNKQKMTRPGGKSHAGGIFTPKSSTPPAGYVILSH
jgi:hypothetical protein